MKGYFRAVAVLASLAAVLAVPDAASAGPFHLRERIQARFGVQPRLEARPSLQQVQPGPVQQPQLAPGLRLSPQQSCPDGRCPLAQPKLAPPVFGAPPAAPQVGGPISGLIDRLKERVVVRVSRERAVATLVANGNAGKKVTRAEAKDLVDSVTDDDIVAAGVQYGALGDGKIWQTVQHFLQWLSSPEGQAVIQNIVKFIVSLIALFGDRPVAVWLVPHGDGFVAVALFEGGLIAAYGVSSA